jgi:hypothetical protein
MHEAHVAAELAPPQPGLIDFLLNMCLWSIIVALGVLLPFLLLVRTAVWMYLEHNMPTWEAMTIAFITTTLLLLAYVFVLNMRLSLGTTQGLILIVALYVLYALAYVSKENLKHSELIDAYATLHPILRLAVSTMLVADQKAIITDAGRTPHDYSKMKLAINKKSLHYAQNDGFVHAVDLRTQNRPPWLNELVVWYFQSMGFATLRHVGTADHLHISLKTISN